MEEKRCSRGDAKNRLKVPSVSWSGLVVAAAENRGGRNTSPYWRRPKQSDHHFSPGVALSLPSDNLILSPLTLTVSSYTHPPLLFRHCPTIHSFINPFNRERGRTQTVTVIGFARQLSLSKGNNEGNSQKRLSGCQASEGYRCF